MAKAATNREKSLLLQELIHDGQSSSTHFIEKIFQTLSILNSTGSPRPSWLTRQTAGDGAGSQWSEEYHLQLGTRWPCNAVGYCVSISGECGVNIWAFQKRSLMTHQPSEISQIWKNTSVDVTATQVQHRLGESVTFWITRDASSNINIFPGGPQPKPALAQPCLEDLPGL